MAADGWTYVTVGDHRVRYRIDGEQRAKPCSAFTVESYRRGEWREVRNWNSRDWFAIGYHAGREGLDAQTELGFGATTDLTPEARARGIG